MLSAIYDIERSHYSQFGRYLHERHFWGTVLLAAVLHLGAIGIYQLLPGQRVTEVPVKVLNIKLGGMQLPDYLQPSGQQTESADHAESSQALSSAIQEMRARPLKEVHFNRAKTEAVTPQPVKSIPKPSVKKAAKPNPAPKVEMAKPDLPQVKEFALAEKPFVAPVAPQSLQESRPLPEMEPLDPFTLPQEASPPAAPSVPASTLAADATPKRYFREQETQQDTPPAAGSTLGNSREEHARIKTRYTQTISLWIDRNKIYPEEARAAGQGGKVLLRIRINRQGRIMRYMLEQSSGHAAIDRAIAAMVDAANPVPPVPANYPDRRPYLEFLIPINFKP